MARYWYLSSVDALLFSLQFISKVWSLLSKSSGRCTPSGSLNPQPECWRRMVYSSEVILLHNIFFISFCVLKESARIRTAVIGNNNFTVVVISHIHTILSIVFQLTSAAKLILKSWTLLAPIYNTIWGAPSETFCQFSATFSNLEQTLI